MARAADAIRRMREECPGASEAQLGEMALMLLAEEDRERRRERARAEWKRLVLAAEQRERSRRGVL